MHYTYRYAPDLLTVTNKYPASGPDHDETLMEAILSVAEIRKDKAEGEELVHKALFMDALKKSIITDTEFERREHPHYIDDTPTTYDMDYEAFRRHISYYMYDFGTAGDKVFEDPSRSAIIDEIINDGLHQFYNPPGQGDNVKAHVWNFLWREIVLSLGAGISSYSNMGLDFVQGNMWYIKAGANREIQRVDLRTLRNMQSMNDRSGNPEYFSVSATITANQSSSHGIDLDFYPNPDGTESVRYRGRFQPVRLTTTQKYPLGSATHSYVMLQSMYAVAEALKTQGKETVHRDRFLKLLRGGDRTR